MRRFAVLTASPLAFVASPAAATDWTRVTIATEGACAAGPSGFLVAKAKPVVDGMRTLPKGKSIGVQVATIQADFVHRSFDDVATVQGYGTAEQDDLDPMAGRLDASFAEGPVEMPPSPSPTPGSSRSPTTSSKRCRTDGSSSTRCRRADAHGRAAAEA